MTSDAWVLYDQFLLEKSNGTQDLQNDVFKVALMDDTYVPNSATDTIFSSLTGELSTEYGYTEDGVTATQILTITSGNVKWDIDDPQWNIVTNNITFKYIVIYNSDTDGLVGYCIADNTAGGTNVTISADYLLDVIIPSTGIFNEAVQ